MVHKLLTQLETERESMCGSKWINSAWCKSSKFLTTTQELLLSTFHYKANVISIPSLRTWILVISLTKSTHHKANSQNSKETLSSSGKTLQTLHSK